MEKPVARFRGRPWKRRREEDATIAGDQTFFSKRRRRDRLFWLQRASFTGYQDKTFKHPSSIVGIPRNDPSSIL
ncbi:hypothetical protein RJT34_15653 [Clitoria ternatea]|uniref:Uncharacterized protein n=1 Tax=Clitoria ternatea TaxID=43366 RepID=A0AAN9J6U1_CLITE